MTKLELTLELPNRLAHDVQEAGLLTPKNLKALLEDAMRRKALKEIREGTRRIAAAGIPPLSLDEIQSEVKTIRAARKTRKR